MPPRAFPATAAVSQNPGVRAQPGNILASFSLLPEAIYSAIPKQFDLISKDRGSTTARWSVVEVRRGEPVKCLSQIFNYVSRHDKGSACWGHHSRPAPSEHCIKVVKQICLLHRHLSDLENIPLCEFCPTRS